MRKMTDLDTDYLSKLTAGVAKALALVGDADRFIDDDRLLDAYRKLDALMFDLTHLSEEQYYLQVDERRAAAGLPSQADEADYLSRDRDLVEPKLQRVADEDLTEGDVLGLDEYSAL